MFSKAIERIVASKGAYLPKIHKDTVLSMSISDEDTDAGSDFIELQPVDKYKENKVLQVPFLYFYSLYFPI
jgi:hypothetical protein